MSDTFCITESTPSSARDKAESTQADPSNVTVKSCEEVPGTRGNRFARQISGHKIELNGERVMRRSATTTREVKLPLSFRTLDTREVFSTTALLDSGATDSFIDKGMINRYGLKIETLNQPIPVYNADGGRNKLGDITGYVDLEMKIGDHKEVMRLHATSLGQERIFIGHDWLKKHNPDINWDTGEIFMSRCPKKTCGYEYHRKRAEKQRKGRVERRAAKMRFEQFRHDLLQPTCHEVEDEYWAQTRINRFIIDPYAWDPSAEHSPTDQEQDDLYEELVGDKEWDDDDETERYDPAKLNETLRAQGVNRRARRSFIRATTTKSAELAAKANAEKKPKTFEEIVPEYLHDYRSVFEKVEFDEMPPHRPWDHKIELVDGAQPWDHTRLIPLSDDETQALDDFLDENLRTGRIRESKSPWASPFFFARKKDGKLRPVQDYRRLNALTKKNRTPLPLIKETIDQLKGAKYFTKMDVRWGFNNIRIAEGDEEKGAFITKRGLFEPMVMFFGMTNSPATFQTMMNNILRPLIKQKSLFIWTTSSFSRRPWRSIVKSHVKSLRSFGKTTYI